MFGLLSWLAGLTIANVQETLVDAQAIENAKQKNADSYLNARGKTVYLTGPNPKARGPIVFQDVSENGHRVGLNRHRQIVRDYTEEFADEKIAEFRRRPKKGKTVVKFDDGIAHWSTDAVGRALRREEKLRKYYYPYYGSRYKDIHTGDVYVIRYMPYVRYKNGSVHRTSFYFTPQGMLVRPTDEALRGLNTPEDIAEIETFISFFNDLQTKGGYLVTQYPECANDDEYLETYGNPFYCNEFALEFKTIHDGPKLLPVSTRDLYKEKEAKKPITSWIYRVQRLNSVDGSLCEMKKTFRVFAEYQIGDTIELDKCKWIIIDKHDWK